MVRRPPFEEANYPPPPRDTGQWITIAVIIAAIAVVTVFSYNYWDVSDWSWFSVRKP